MATILDLMGLGMPPALAANLGNTPATVAGVGTAQSGAGVINKENSVTLLTTSGGATAFILPNLLSLGRPFYIWNTSATTALVYPPVGGNINGVGANTAISLIQETGGIFMLVATTSSTSSTWQFISGAGSGSSGAFTNVTASGTLGVTGVTTATGGLVVGAGSATVVPFQMTSGTLNTTSSAGEFEYDGSVFYGDVAAGQRGIIPVESYITNNAAITLTATASAQSMFAGTGGTTNGALTLPIGTYEFETQFALTALSATSGSFGWGLLAANSAVIGAQLWTAVASKVAVGTVQAVDQSFNTATSTAITSATTATAGCAFIKGTFTLTTGGSIAPQISLANSATPVVSAGSYFRCTPIALVTATLVDVGKWS